MSGPQEPPRDQSTSRPSPKLDKGKAKMPEYEDSDGNESAHSLDSEFGGLDVPIMRTPEHHVVPPERRTQSADSATTTTWHIIMHS